MQSERNDFHGGDVTLLYTDRRKLNSLALSRHTQLLEVLEIPQVMETCVRNGYYEEALDLNTHVRRMGKKHGDISIIKVSVMYGHNDASCDCHMTCADYR